MGNCQEVGARQVEDHILVSCQCTMKGRLPITQIHDVTAVLEDRVKEKFPQIYRVTIHPEPFEEKKRHKLQRVLTPLGTPGNALRTHRHQCAKPNATITRLRRSHTAP